MALALGHWHTDTKITQINSSCVDMAQYLQLDMGRIVYFDLLVSVTKSKLWTNILWSCRSHGIFHLSDPGGVTVIRNCQERGFHPHEEPSDGSSLYEHCSHVFLNSNLRFDVVDLRDGWFLMSSKEFCFLKNVNSRGNAHWYIACSYPNTMLKIGTF